MRKVSYDLVLLLEEVGWLGVEPDVQAVEQEGAG